MTVCSPPKYNPTWQMSGNLMRFDKLDAFSGTVYALAYKFTDNDAEPWTKRFIGFKSKLRRDVAAACVVLPGAVTTLPNRLDVSAVLGAIPSSATSLDAAHPIAQLGAALAACVGVPWRPDLLTKAAHRKLHSLKTHEERDTEISGMYDAAAEGLRTVLVVDDFVTRGSTLREITRALRLTNPNANVIGIALAKTEKQGYWQEKRGVTLDNAHASTALAAAWEGTP